MVRKGKVWLRSRLTAVAFTVLAAGMLVFALVLSQKGYGGTEPEQAAGPETRQGMAAFPVDMPDTVFFAGERMPLEYFDVREALDRELMSNTYFHSQTMLLIKRANRFFPVIEPILSRYGIPDDLKYLTLAESGLANVVSPAEAVGFWQLVKGTAKELGLQVDEQVDERYSVARSTEAACRYLLESYAKYGNWTMAAASYNAGRKGVDRQIERQKTEAYYDLLLNEETARYIYRVVAYKLIMEDPAAYGFFIPQRELYEVIPVDTVIVSGSVENFADFAFAHGTNYKILKALNPWLRDVSLANPEGRRYLIEVPVKGARNAAYTGKSGE